MATWSPSIDLNLEIADGEFMVLVGPSGCGKTTTLRMIAGLEEITEGELLIGDRVVNDVAPKDRDIAMVFQSYALYPHMTSATTSRSASSCARSPKADIEQRINEAAEHPRPRASPDRKPKELSGGQRQRVALGRAIVREPAVFLMDEPLSNLDAKLRVQTRAEIARLHQRLGTTMVYVTHDQVEAMTMGHRIAVMSDGLLQQVGSPAGAVRPPGEPLRRRLHRHPGDELHRSRPTAPATAQVGFTFAVPAAFAEGVSTPATSSSSASGPSISIADTGGGSARPGHADVVEYLGNEELLHVAVAAMTWSLVVSADRVRPGDVVSSASRSTRCTCSTPRRDALPRR